MSRRNSLEEKRRRRGEKSSRRTPPSMGRFGACPMCSKKRVLGLASGICIRCAEHIMFQQLLLASMQRSEAGEQPDPNQLSIFDEPLTESSQNEEAQ